MPESNSPFIIVLAGPNGAGKTSSAKRLLPQEFNVQRFVNADNIALGLSPFNPSLSEIKAGRLMLESIRDLTQQGESFAFETTLASRTFVSHLSLAQKAGYHVSVLFLWLSSPDLAVARVKLRVSQGGHNVPEEVVRRRYKRGLENFFRLYRPLADSWTLGDNSAESTKIVARGEKGKVERIIDRDLYQRIVSTAQHERNEDAQ